MADLDDFFAKKDRKKKSVKKFATAEEMTKKLDDGKQKASEVRPKKERPAQEGEEGARPGEEEEWKEYEETVKDYTGLKIQVLQGGAAPDTGRDSASEDSAPDNGKGKGPWNKPQPQSEPAPAPRPEPEKPRDKPAAAAYVPPVARVAARPEPLRRNAAKHAPDIHNDDNFPVLGAAGAGAARREGGWSVPAAPAARHRDTDRARAPLALGNRYDELRHDS